MTMQEMLDKRAKNCGYDFAQKLGNYKGYDVWTFSTNEPRCLGYPLFILVKGEKTKTVVHGDKYHREIWNYANSLSHDDDDEDDD